MNKCKYIAMIVVFALVCIWFITISSIESEKTDELADDLTVREASQITVTVSEGLSAYAHSINNARAIVFISNTSEKTVLTGAGGYKLQICENGCWNNCIFNENKAGIASNDLGWTLKENERRYCDFEALCGGKLHKGEYKLTIDNFRYERSSRDDAGYVTVFLL